MTNKSTDLTAPSKSDELAILNTAINVLGPQSYLGPWLSQVRAEVERDIRSDIFPSISLADAREQATAIIAEAQREAAEIVVAAQKQAEQARTTAFRAVVDARRDVEKASKELERVVGWVSNR